MKEIMLMLPDEKEKKAIKTLVRELSPDATIYMPLNEARAYNIALRSSVDVFVLDIDFRARGRGELQAGAMLAQKLRSVEKYYFTPIIYLMDEYDERVNLLNLIQCHGIFKRPYDMDAVRDALRSALEYHTKDSMERKVILQTEGMMEVVAVEDIIWADVSQRKLFISTVDGDFMLPNKSCKELLQELNSEYFVRCRRGTIVNMKYIKKVESSKCRIHLKKGKGVLEIGSAVKKDFLRKVKRRYSNIVVK